MKVTGTLFHTQGGLAIDEKARVIKNDGSVIQGLFACGGQFVVFLAQMYPGIFLETAY